MKLHYEIVNKGSGPEILYLHGFMGSAADWRPVIKYLGASFRHITVDLPGHGRSLNQSSYDASSVMKALLILLDDLGIGQTYLVGYSMGGRLALRLALEYPGRFKALALESASPGISDKAGREARKQNDWRIADELEKGDYKTFLHHWYLQPIFGLLAKNRDYDSLINRRLQNDPRELARALRGLSVAVQPSLWDRLQDIQIPALVICGEQDEKYRRISKEMLRRNPRFARLVIKNSGHNTHFEQSANFARALELFLKKSSV